MISECWFVLLGEILRGGLGWVIVRVGDYCTERDTSVGRVTYISPREKKKKKSI